MKMHYHFSIDNVLLIGLSAIVVIDLLGLSAAWLARKDGVIGQIGTVIGAVVPFKG